MSLTDLMSHMDLAIWPQAALVIFLGVFFAVAWRTFKGVGAKEQEALAGLPFDEGTASTAMKAAQSGKGQV